MNFYIYRHYSKLFEHPSYYVQNIGIYVPHYSVYESQENFRNFFQNILRLEKYVCIMLLNNLNVRIVDKNLRNKI